MVNNVANCDKLPDSLGHGVLIYIWFPITYFTVLLIDKTKFPTPGHALKNSVAVKELNNVRNPRFRVFKQYAC